MATGSNPPGSEQPVLNIVGERVVLGLPPVPVTAEKERGWYEDRSKAENDLSGTLLPTSRARK